MNCVCAGKPPGSKISRERFLELKYFCLQYESLSTIHKALIDSVIDSECGDLAEWIKRDVTTGISFEKLSPPCGRRQYYAIRRLFFEKLSALK